jgi:hypothetical protein
VPSLATVADLETRLGHSVDDAAKAQAAIDDVSAAVQAYTGQLFVRAVTTDRLRVRRGLVRLPQRPVNAVSAVELDLGTAVSFTWLTGDDQLSVSAAESSGGRTESVLVTYDHGYDVIPGDVVAIACNIANRALGIDPASGALSQRSITNYQETYGPIGASGAAGLFNSEASILDRYRRRGSVAWVGVS